MTGRQLARALEHRARALPGDKPAEILQFGVAQVRPRRLTGRVALALRLGFVAVTGRAPW